MQAASSTCQWLVIVIRARYLGPGLGRKTPALNDPLGEAEHVGVLGVLGAASALVGRQCAIRINLSLESLQELLSGWPGACASVVGAAP
jgi:hypothetical protein